MKTAIYPVNTQATGSIKVQFCNTEDEVKAILEKHGEAINLIYAGTVENLPEIYKPYLTADKHPAFENAILDYENVVIFQWQTSEV